MAHERVYHPETCEPFDVPATKAQDLVLQNGWSRTPWTQAEVAPDPDVFEPVRGRGRKRRVVEAESVPELETADEGEDAAEVEVDEVDTTDESWRS